MVAKLDTKSRTILAIAAGIAGDAWCAVLGFHWLIGVFVAIGAALPIWVMSRGVLHESRAGGAPDDTPSLSSEPEHVADVVSLDRVRLTRARHGHRPDSSRLTG